jgi:hypothetical protein
MNYHLYSIIRCLLSREKELFTTEGAEKGNSSSKAKPKSYSPQRRKGRREKQILAKSENHLTTEARSSQRNALLPLPLAPSRQGRGKEGQFYRRERRGRRERQLSSKSENYISSWRHRGTVGQGASH